MPKILRVLFFVNFPATFKICDKSMHDFQNRESLWSECNIQNWLLWMSNNIFLSYCAFVFCWSWIRQVSTRLFWSLFSFHPLNPQRFVGKLKHQTVWWVESLFFVISNNMTNHCCFAEEKQLKTWRAFSLLLWPVIHHMAITKTFSVSHFSVFVLSCAYFEYFQTK